MRSAASCPAPACACSGKLDDEDIAGIRRAFGANVESVDVSTKFQTLSSAGTAMVASEPGTDTTGDASYQALQLSTAFPPWTQVNPQWPLQRVNNRNFNQSAGAALPYAFEAPGSGVNAYLVDTGLRFSHEEFGQFPAGGGTPRAVHGMSGPFPWVHFLPVCMGSMAAGCCRLKRGGGVSAVCGGIQKVYCLNGTKKGGNAV